VQETVQSSYLPHFETSFSEWGQLTKWEKILRYKAASQLSTFPRIPQAQHVDGRFLDFVAHLVMPHEDAANLARLELFKLLTDARVLQEADR
jgi:hypothetical protein